MSERSAYSVDALVRVVGNNEFVTHEFRLPGWALRHRNTFTDCVWKELGTIIDAQFFQAPPQGQILSLHPPVFLLQETTSGNHKWKHVQWSTLTWDEEGRWPDYFTRNILQGSEITLAAELHIGWEFIVPGTGPNLGPWSKLEREFAAAGYSHASLGAKLLKRVIVEGNGHHFIQDTWNTARFSPRRPPVEPAPSCTNCQEAAAKAGNFKRLGAIIKEETEEYNRVSSIMQGVNNIRMGQERGEPADVDMAG
jgi:hypothetical protein